MARDDAPPFDRGQYEASENFDHLIGRDYKFEDIDWSSTSMVKPFRSGKMVRCRLVKNSSGAAVLPKRLCKFSTTAGPTYYNAQVSGFANATNQRAYPADEFLPAAGAPDASYFYIVVEGPAMCRTPLAGSEFNGDISVGGVLAALTAVTAGATTSGRVANQIITGSSQATDYSVAIDAAENYVGRALSAATSAQTNSDILVDVGHW